VNEWLLDTGPLVAYIDRNDPAHEMVAEALNSFAGQLFTTSAVVTEALFLTRRHRSGPEATVQFLLRTATIIAECTDAATLSAAVSFMRKYADTPMDFADATLVLIAERLSIYKICTLDLRGFRIFRTRKGKSFDLVLSA
jgi:uncharacterized protein